MCTCREDVEAILIFLCKKIDKDLKIIISINFSKLSGKFVTPIDMYKITLARNANHACFRQSIHDLQDQCTM